MSNILIVESTLDQCFVEALIRHEEKYQTKIKPIFKYEAMSGLSQKKLSLTIENIFAEMGPKGKYEKIGILIDQDDNTTDDRLKLINDALKDAFKNSAQFQVVEQVPHFEATNQFIPLSEDLQIGCCFTHVDGKGELETLLRTIHTSRAPYADCLESWRVCVEEADPKCNISQKEIDKLWVNNYHRYDTCSVKERKNVGKHCSFEAAMKKDIYDFNHAALADIKAFLQQLTSCKTRSENHRGFP